MKGFSVCWRSYCNPFFGNQRQFIPQSRNLDKHFYDVNISLNKMVGCIDPGLQEVRNEGEKNAVDLSHSVGVRSGCSKTGSSLEQPTPMKSTNSSCRENLVMSLHVLFMWNLAAIWDKVLRQQVDFHFFFIYFHTGEDVR